MSFLPTRNSLSRFSVSLLSLGISTTWPSLSKGATRSLTTRLTKELGVATRSPITLNDASTISVCPRRWSAFWASGREDDSDLESDATAAEKSVDSEDCNPGASESETPGICAAFRVELPGTSA